MARYPFTKFPKVKTKCRKVILTLRMLTGADFSLLWGCSFVYTIASNGWLGLHMQVLNLQTYFGFFIKQYSSIWEINQTYIKNSDETFLVMQGFSPKNL